MRILVTGGAGFQGSHLTERLLRSGHRVTILNTHSEESERNLKAVAGGATVVWGSVTDPEIVEKTVRNQDVVFHMAARINVDESIHHPGSYLQANVIGTFNVLEAVRKEGVRLIYSSSCEVYGATHGQPVQENSEINPYSPYAASKAAADRLCYAYSRTYAVDVTIVRPTNIYGPRQKAGKGGAVIPIFVHQALSRKPLVIFGSGQQRREYLHVEDLASAYELVLKNSSLAGEVINFGSGETPSIREIAEFIANELGSTIEFGPARPGEVAGFLLDATKAARIGFKPEVPFWEGLKRYIDWTRKTL
ncbi:MAG: NAD-dependent epimerase/dehydratase family protein [Chloroflexota bacterium]